MGKLKISVVAATILLGLAISIPVPQVLAATTTAQNSSPASQVQDGLNQISSGDKNADKSLLTTMHSVINILLYIIGALAVIMIIYGGLKYVTSRGESAEVTSAKNTIMYAVVGLVIAMLAYAIVGFVVGSLDASAKNACSDPKNQPAPHHSGPTPIC